jgi:O-antigen/teichoic acid export membrane protein
MRDAKTSAAAITGHFAYADALRHTALVFFTTVAINVANFVFHFGAIRMLGLQSYSALAALYAIVLILSVPANVLQAIVTTIVGEANCDQAEGIRRATIRIAAAISCSIVLLALFLAPSVASYLSINDTTTVYLLFLTIALGFSAAAFRGVLQGQQRFGTFAASLVIEGGGNLALGLSLIALIGGVRSAMTGHASAVACASAFALMAVWGFRRPGKFKVDVRRLVAKFVGTTFALSALAAMSWGDVILVRHLTPVHVASLYGAMSIIGKMILFSVSFLPLVLLPKVSRLKGEKMPTRPLFLFLIAIGLAICILEIAAIKVAPAQVLSFIAGAAASGAAPYLFTYASAMIMLAMTIIVAHYGIGTHRFAFVGPLVFIEFGEIVAINLRHASLHQILQVIVFGHTFAFFVTAAIVYLGGRQKHANDMTTPNESISGIISNTNSPTTT